MSRFGNLEFEGESNRHGLPEHKLPARDETFYLQQANLAFESGSFEVALRNYSKVLEFNPKNAAAWTGQVRMLIELGEFREAKLWADKAIERFPSEGDLLAAKAVALARSGDLEAALAFSDAAIEERGDTAYIWLARGDVLLARKESLAEYCLEKAMMLSPQSWLVAWLTARIHYYYGQFAKALKAIEQAVEWNPGHFLVWLERGACQQSLGLFGPAENSFTQARQLNPDCAAATKGLNQVRSTSLIRRILNWPARFFK